MKKDKKVITRRDFLRLTATATVASAAGLSVFAEESQKVDKVESVVKKAKVILVRDANVLDDSKKVNAKVLEKMLDDAVTSLVGTSDPIEAWKQFVKPTDIVGVKSNHWNPLRTPPELEEAIKKRLIDAGIKEDKISVGDRGILNNPIFQQATALINARPMRTHDWAGVGSLIKNYIQFSPSPSSWHNDSCANLAQLWDLPIVKGKTRLNILVLLTPLFHSKGPHNYQEQYTWAYKGLLVGTDPVAIDATGVRIIEAKRLAYFGKDLPFEVSPKHIRIAEEKFHLGIADASRIEVKKLGWMEDVLI